MAIRVNENILSIKYFRKLIRYFDKGFNLILKNLDITKMSKRALKYDLIDFIELPYLLIKYT